jgi:predicted transcriptional regulator
MEELSHHEERIMQIIWSLEKALVRDILEALPDPQPPYTTLASSVKLLEKKGYLTHKSYGTTHMYFPLISQSGYSKRSANRLMKNYFEGSVGNFLSFMVKENKISDQEIAELQKLIDDMDKPEEK